MPTEQAARRAIRLHLESILLNIDQIDLAVAEHELVAALTEVGRARTAQRIIAAAPRRLAAIVAHI